ncbi:MAG: DsbA family protein, partial [Acidimicrobiales bacterium]
VRAAHANLTSAGAELGLDFRWAGMRRANSHDAHRLLTWALAAGTPADQHALKGRLLRAYFTEHRDIADHAVLARLADEAGLDAASASAVLASGRFSDEVRTAEAAGAELGIHAVPTYLIEGTFAIPGAQDPEAFRDLLQRARHRLAPVVDARPR